MRLTSSRDWLNRLVRSNHALALLFLLSMAETLVLPVPLELVLIPWMLCHPERKWTIAAVALAGNLTAAIGGYYLGFFFMDKWGPALIDFFGDQDTFEALKQELEEDGFLTIATIGLSPIPFQIAMLAAGATGYSVFLFALAAILARGVRYFGLAALVAIAGKAALDVWERYSKPIGIFILGAVGVWLWMQFSS